MGAVVVVIYASWIYNYLCNQCLSPLMLWVRISNRARCTTLCDKVCQWLATVLWFSPGPSVSSTNKTDRQDITEILWTVALETTKQTNKHYKSRFVVPCITYWFIMQKQITFTIKSLTVSMPLSFLWNQLCNLSILHGELMVLSIDLP